MFEFNAEDYGKTVAPLLHPPRLNELGPGTPNIEAKPGLETMSGESVLDTSSTPRPQMGKACVAGLWLLHDFLEESHNISQAIDTPTGSYWHGIMHRREPDASNAKYWFRKVGDHPVFEPLRENAAELCLARREQREKQKEADFLLAQSAWDPFAWIDLCEEARQGGNSCEQLCREIQQLEWQLLFDYCYRSAQGE